MFYRTFSVFIRLKGDLSQALFDTLFLGMYTYVVFNFIYDHETCRHYGCMYLKKRHSVKKKLPFGIILHGTTTTST